MSQFEKLAAGTTRQSSVRPNGLEPCCMATLGVSVAIVLHMSRLLLPLGLCACLGLAGAGFARATRMGVLSATLNILIIVGALLLLTAAVGPEIFKNMHDSTPNVERME